MNELRKAAEMALEALEIGYDSAQAEAHQFHAAMAGYKPQRHAAMDADVQKIAAAITALRQALKQSAQQEPVAWMYESVCGNDFATRHKPPEYAKNIRPLYTTPPQREWVGLTDAEIGIVSADIWGSVLIAPQSYQAFAHAIEAKLKENFSTR